MSGGSISVGWRDDLGKVTVGCKQMDVVASHFLPTIRPIYFARPSSRPSPMAPSSFPINIASGSAAAFAPQTT